MDTFMQVLITIVIGIANLLVVTMTKHHHKKVVVFITIFISAVILIITWRIACPVIPVEILPEDYSTAESKDTDVIETDLAQYLGHPMSEILNVVPDHKLEKNDDDEIKYSAPNMSITGKNQNYLTRIYLSGTESEYSVDGILLGISIPLFCISWGSSFLMSLILLYSLEFCVFSLLDTSNLFSIFVYKL